MGRAKDDGDISPPCNDGHNMVLPSARLFVAIKTYWITDICYKLLRLIMIINIMHWTVTVLNIFLNVSYHVSYHVLCNSVTFVWTGSTFKKLKAHSEPRPHP